MERDRRFIAVGHRGAPRELSPNTMAGFRRAAEIGCAMVECDVRRSADGVLVLAHDGHVTDSDGRVYEITATTADRLAAADIGGGEGVPTLAALADWALEAGVAVMADMKTAGDGAEEATAAVLKALPASLKIVPGASLDARRLFRAADPGLPLSLSLGRSDLTERRFEYIVDEHASLAIDAVTFEWPLLTAERVAALQGAGLRVFAWTVDDDLLMARLADWGVDGIISNRAELAVNLATGISD